MFPIYLNIKKNDIEQAKSGSLVQSKRFLYLSNYLFLVCDKNTLNVFPLVLIQSLNVLSLLNSKWSVKKVFNKISKYIQHIT